VPGGSSSDGGSQQTQQRGGCNFMVWYAFCPQDILAMKFKDSTGQAAEPKQLVAASTEMCKKIMAFRKRIQTAARVRKSKAKTQATREAKPEPKPEPKPVVKSEEPGVKQEPSESEQSTEKAFWNFETRQAELKVGGTTYVSSKLVPKKQNDPGSI
jgi:hypothetical protein